MDEKTTFHELKEVVKKFCEERDWDKFHNAKDLEIGISTESSELLEHFRFKTNDEIDNFFNDNTKKEEITDELSDILYFVLRFAQKYNIDISDSFQSKLKKIKIKYPIDKSFGKNLKYNEL